MLSDICVAKYFLDKDINSTEFTKDLIKRNGRKFYEGNARLNKYLHLAQNIYIAKTGKKLIDVDFYAYDNGAVSTNIQANYVVLLDNKNISCDKIPEEEKCFLEKFHKAFRNATIDELIELSHEDVEWQNRSNFYNKEHQKMDSLKFKKQYKKQYEDIVKMLDRV